MAVASANRSGLHLKIRASCLQNRRNRPLIFTHICIFVFLSQMLAAGILTLYGKCPFLLPLLLSYFQFQLSPVLMPCSAIIASSSTLTRRYCTIILDLIRKTSLPPSCSTRACHLVSLAQLDNLFYLQRSLFRIAFRENLTGFFVYIPVNDSLSVIFSKSSLRFTLIYIFPVCAV